MTARPGGQRTFLYVVGTRPNFMKIAPVLEAMRVTAAGDRHLLVHTGQHYDDAMSRVFFDDLGMPAPDLYLGIGSGMPGAQTARVIESLESFLVQERPDVVVVPGDVNSTLGAALAAAKQDIPVAHVEAGLRSFDPTMPEELNRILTDRISALLFIHSPEARENLVAEGIRKTRIHSPGNTMIDTVARLLERATPDLFEHHEIPGRYLLVTLHRPALVDGPLLGQTIDALEDLALELPVVFPVHPRTRARIDASSSPTSRVRLLPPAGYLEFLALERHAAAVLTDSGGVQEETTYLGVPCFTLRDNTERPVTVTQGTNTLLGLSPERIAELPSLTDGTARRRARVPETWDGRAAGRLAETLSASIRATGER